MKKEIEKYFDLYDEGHLRCPFVAGVNCKRYYHKKEDYFQVGILEDSDVFQLDFEGEMQGIPLATWEDLKIRFKSFTGEDIEDIDE